MVDVLSGRSVVRIPTSPSEIFFFQMLFSGTEGEIFLTSGQGWNPPDLACRPCLRKANLLESLKAGYWGRITTDNPSLRDRVYDQSWVLEEEG